MADLAPHHRTLLGRATIGDQLRRHARTRPDKVAFIAYAADGARAETTYAELNARADRYAQLFTARGIGRGGRIASMARNSVEVVAAYYGALKVGAAFTGVNPLYRETEVAHQLGHSRAGLVLADDAFAGVVAAAAPERDLLRYGPELDALLDAQPGTEPVVELDENDVALIVYTSGTEAAPKGVLIPHRNYLASTAPAWGWGLQTGPEDTWLFVMPFHTIAGLGSMTSLTLMGATLVLPATADPATAVQVIGRERVTVIAQTPTFYIGLAAEEAFGEDTVGQVRRCMTYGGQIPPHVIEAWSAAAPDVLWGTYWGQSELSQLGTVGFFRTLDDVPGGGDPTWIGKPVTHLEIRVVDAEDNDADVGELICRTPSAMLGYLDDPERTAEVFRGGWVRTGDMVRVDAAGNLFFHDRLKDMIKSGGMNVSSQEVERVLYGHPSVERAAIVGMPDPYWSEAVTAFVVVRAGQAPTPDELIAHCREHLAVYKVPKAVHLVDELPVDPQGKILKRRLRETAPA